MRERLPSTLNVCSSSTDINNMPPPQKAKNNSDAAETVSWTDDEVELLLGVVRSYSSQKDYQGLEWESVISKYEDIRRKSIRIRWKNCLHYKTLRTEQHIGYKVLTLD